MQKFFKKNQLYRYAVACVLVLVALLGIFQLRNILFPTYPIGQFYQSRWSNTIQAQTVAELNFSLDQQDNQVAFTVGEDDNQVTFFVPFAKPDSDEKPTPNNNKITFDGPDQQKLTYTVLKNGLQEELVLAKPPTESSFITLLELGTNQIKINPNGIPTFFNQQGEYLFELGKPFAQDAAGNITYEITYEISTDPSTQKTKLTKHVSPDWLFSAERTFPIIIDPTVITIANSKTPTISENYLHDNVQIADTTPLIKFGAIDPQADDLVYEVSWDTDSSFPAPTTVASDANAGFADETTPADTSPFESGDVITYTFQSALSNNTTYFYRLRAKDPAGDNTYSSYSAIRSFTINTSTVDATWFQTHADQFSTSFKTASVTVNSGTNDVEAADTSTNTRYYKPITITNSSSELTNHHVLVELDTAALIAGSKLASDCSDLRVSSDNDGQTPLDFWIEQGCNTSTTQIWIEVPVVPVGDSIIYFIYDYITGITDSEVNWAGNFIFASNASCSVGYTTDSTMNTYIARGNTAYGATGGGNHSHTASGSLDFVGGVNSCTNSGGSNSGGHSHTFSSGSSSVGSTPPYVDFMFCQQGTDTDPIDTQYFGFFTTVPTGWSMLTGYQDRFVRGNSSYGGTGGANTHSHGINFNSGGAGSSYDSNASTGGSYNMGQPGHSHGLVATSTGGGNIPPFYALKAARPSSNDTMLPVGIILPFDSAPPLGWTRYTQLDDRFLRITETTATNGTGNSAPHSHTVSGLSQSNSGTTAIVNTTPTNGCVPTEHEHNFSGSLNSLSALPPYKNLLFYTRSNDNVTTSVGAEVLSTGYMLSTAITADYLGETRAKWDTFSFTDDETNGDIKYRVYYDDNGFEEIVPDGVLAGNSAGFDSSPVDISAIDSTVYPTLYLTATFEYSGGSAKLQDWSVTVNSAPAIPTLNSPSNAATNQSRYPVLQTTTTDQNSDAIRYKIELCTNLAMTTGCQTFDQSTSQTGWTGQNALTSTAYTSGSQGTYTVQTALASNTTYYWRSYAIDPNGSNRESYTQTTPNSFTTSQSPNTPTLDSPANAATGVSLTPILLTTGTDANSDALRYRIYLCTDASMIGCQIFNQTVSQTGWTGQNALTSTAYTSGTQASYTVQTNLNPNTTYYWKSQAIDPNGSNEFGPLQGSPNSFTTAAQPKPPSQCVIRETTNDSSLTLEWSDDSANEDGFQIERSVDGGGFSLLTSPAANATSYQDTTVSQTNTYQYRVRSHFTVSAVTSYSSWCTTSTLSLESGLFNFEGLNLEGLNLN